MNSKARFTRRRWLSGAGIATGALALGRNSVALGSAADVPPGPELLTTEGLLGDGYPAPAAPLTNPAWTYQTVSYEGFIPVGTPGGLTVGTNGLSAATATSLRCPLSLPHGAILREVTFWVFNSSPSTGLSVGISVVTPPSAFAGGVTAFTQAAQNAHTVNLTSFFFNPIDNSTKSYALSAFLQSGTVHGLIAARVGWEPPAQVIPGSVFVPLEPFRAYDSRQAGYAPNNGRLAPNTSRVVSIKDARDGGGALVTADVVPSVATAVTYNLTVSGATGPNFLAVTPGDATSFTASALNFGGGADVANAATVRIAADRSIRVWAGDQSGSAHAIVDVTGYFRPAS
jgi:hypothetical protein